MSEDKSPREILAQLAMLGAALGTVRYVAPILLNGGVGGLGNPIIATGFTALTGLPFAGLAVVGSFIPYTLFLTRRIPKQVGVPRIKPHSWKVPIGKTYWGKWVYFDFGGVIPHSITAGATKFGKTAFLKMVLYVLCHQQPPEWLQILIIDLKGGASFYAWRHVPHVLDVKRTVDEAEEVMEAAETEMWRRLDEIREAQLAFREVPKFPHLFVVVDEGSLLKLSDKAMKHLQNIAAIGREPHVHLLYGTQRPSHEILPVTIRDNMEGRFVFNLNEPGSSKVVLGEHDTSAYRFTNRPGRMFHQDSGYKVELQASYVDDETIRAWLMDCARLVDVEGEVMDEACPSSVSPHSESIPDSLRFLG